MSNLNGNKYAAAIFATLLVGIGASELSHMAFSENIPEQPGYLVETADATQHDEDHAVIQKIDLGALLAGADPGAGAKIARKCTACHEFQKGGVARQGPPLWNVLGRAVASHGGFKYSKAMTERGGVWDYQALYDYLEKPAAALPGTAMNFVGLRKQKDRVNFLSWLGQQSDRP